MSWPQVGFRTRIRTRQWIYLRVKHLRVSFAGMNAMTHPQPMLGAFHRERSNFIDAFADCEIEVCALLRSLAVPIGNEPFSQRLLKLGKCQPASGYAKERKARVDAALAQLSEVLPVRADVVHARMKLVTIEGVNFACFVNAREQAAACPAARLVSFENFRAITRRVAKIAEDLRAP